MISIIIPVYNVEPYLRYSINSVLAQDYRNFEIILVDDGSTDGSGAICDKYALECGIISVIHKKNGGLSSARNAGLEVAKGDYIMFLDSDDYLHPKALSVLSKVAKQYLGTFDYIQFLYKEVSTYHTSFENIDKVESAMTTSKAELFDKLFKLGGVGASACTKLYRKEVFDNLKFKEGIIHEDELLTTCLIDSAKAAVFVDVALYMYFIRPGSIITTTYTHKKLDIIGVRNYQTHVLDKNGLHELVTASRSKLFTSLCTLYVDARKQNAGEDCNRISAELKRIQSSGKINTNGAISLIDKGLRLHLPILQLYYYYNKWAK